LPDRTPEAIEETLLEVCFGELFLAPDAAALLFDPLVLALVVFGVEGFAAALLEAVERVPPLFAAAGFALLFGAAARPAPLLLLDDAGFALLLFPPREPALPPPAFTAIFFAPAVQRMPSIDAQRRPRDWLWQASESLGSIPAARTNTPRVLARKALSGGLSGPRNQRFGGSPTGRFSTDERQAAAIAQRRKSIVAAHNRS